MQEQKNKTLGQKPEMKLIRRKEEKVIPTSSELNNYLCKFILSVKRKVG